MQMLLVFDVKVRDMKAELSLPPLPSGGVDPVYGGGPSRISENANREIGAKIPDSFKKFA